MKMLLLLGLIQWQNPERTVPRQPGMTCGLIKPLMCCLWRRQKPEDKSSLPRLRYATLELLAALLSLRETS